MERHRLIWLYLIHKTNLFSDDLNVLHFAPEYVFQKKLSSAHNLDYVSADLDSSSAMVKMDITNIAFAADSFDAILCIHVLEHVIDDHKAMRELFRVLKPRGWAIIQVDVHLTLDKTFEDPTIMSAEDRESVFGQSDHVRIYGRDYKDKLERAGFVVHVSECVRRLPPNVIKKYGLMQDEGVYLCCKP